MAEPTASSFERQLSSVPSYEAPRVETVLTAEELEREVLYAGNLNSLPG